MALKKALKDNFDLVFPKEEKIKPNIRRKIKKNRESFPSIQIEPSKA